MEKEIKEMFDLAMAARENAYAPYSHFKVGAVCKMKDGTFVTGCNVENSSYGATICAERNAMFKAISMGYKIGDFDCLLEVGDTPGICYPCGMCRQVMSEFYKPSDKIILCNIKGDYHVYRLDEILPYAFDKEDLKNV